MSARTAQEATTATTAVTVKGKTGLEGLLASQSSVWRLRRGLFMGFGWLSEVTGDDHKSV